MKMFLVAGWLIIGILAMNLFFGPIKDVSAQDDDLRMQLKKMEEMMQKQQGMIDDLKTKIEMQEDISKSYVAPIDDELIGKKVDEYLEKGEGKGMWAEIMKRPKLGYKRGFYFQTQDKSFSMMINGRIQFRYSYEDRDNIHDTDEQQDDSSFRIRRSRVKFSGNAFKHFKYKIELALSSTGGAIDGSRALELFDFWASWNKNPAASIKFGQWKVPWSRQRVVSSQNLQLIDRASSQDEFTMDRQIGVLLHGKLFNKKFEYYTGVFNGNNRNQSSNGNNEMLYIGRVSWNPFGAYGKGIGEVESDINFSEKPIAHLSAGISFDGAADRERVGSTTIDLDPPVGTGVTLKEVNKTSVVAEYGLKYRGFSTSAEAYWRRFDDIRANNIDSVGSGVIIDRGFFVQGGYFVIPKKFEVAGRYSLVDFDDERDEDAVREITAGVSWFINGTHDNKLQFNWIRQDNELPNVASRSDDIDNTYRLQYQLAF
ncbi:MAG: porin [Planctomycetota bacterium]|jgi:phosphate-selective porin